MPGATSRYGSEVSYALSVIAESFDYLCAERLTPNLVWMANHLAAHISTVSMTTSIQRLFRSSKSKRGGDNPGNIFINDLTGNDCNQSEDE